jgi:tetratricopeptide (TPR) repeat protein
LETVRELEIQYFTLQRDSDEIPADLRALKELQIIKDDLTSQREAALFFCKLLAEGETFWQKSCALKNKIESNPEDPATHLELAEIYSEAGQIMLADRSFQRALQLAPNDFRLHLELSRLYVESRLWGSARGQIQETQQAFPENPEVQVFANGVETEINNIKETIKKAWIAGDRIRSRSLLNEYLMLCPEDVEANRIKRYIVNQDQTVGYELPLGRSDELSPEQFDRLLKKAGVFLESLEFEKTIGIMEGLIKIFSQKTAVLREKIGDIRMLQKDYRSACWNYEQVLKVVPQAPGIKFKLTTAVQKLERLAFGGRCRDSDSHLSL